MSELKFPSVTICSPGLNMEAVKDATLDDVMMMIIIIIIIT